MSPSPQQASRPLVYAHRGGAALRPENTLEAFDHGLALGADGLEFDVQFSRDGVVVESDRIELMANGQVTVIPSAFPGLLGRIAVSRDASFVIAEVTGAGISLYRMALP